MPGAAFFYLLMEVFTCVLLIVMVLEIFSSIPGLPRSRYGKGRPTVLHVRFLLILFILHS